jgi:hypothetical protein
LARLLWIKVRAEIKAAEQLAKESKDSINPALKQLGQGPFERPGGTQKGQAGRERERGQGNGDDDQEGQKDEPGPGHVDTLPDTDQVQPLDGQDARELLACEIRRIERGQAEGPAYSPPENRNVKDW